LLVIEIINRPDALGTPCPDCDSNGGVPRRSPEGRRPRTAVPWANAGPTAPENHRILAFIQI